MKRYIVTILVLAKSYLVRFLRDKTGIFFTLLFPVMFLLVFGSLYANNNDDLQFKVALFNRSDSAFSRQFADTIKKSEAFEVNDSITSLDEARQKMGRGEIDSIVEFPSNFGVPNESGQPSGAVSVYYSEASPQSGQTVAAVMNGVLEEVNSKLGQPVPPLTVEQKSTATNNLSMFDYVLAGLLGFSILSLGIFGLANQMPAEKKTGSFRRLRASPLKKSQLVFANMLFYLTIGVASIALMYLVASLVFGFSMQGSWLNVWAYVIISILVMFGFGLAIGGWAKNETQSAALTNLVAFPMMFLSGVFFPRFLMPEWLQGITGYLPLTPIVDGLRMIMTESKTLIDLGPELALMGVWAVVIYTIAIRAFRWE